MVVLCLRLQLNFYFHIYCCKKIIPRNLRDQHIMWKYTEVNCCTLDIVPEYTIVYIFSYTYYGFIHDPDDSMELSRMRRRLGLLFL